MVVLTFTVTDSRGRYVNGLKPGDFRNLEDGITQKIATFAEGSNPAVQVLADGSTRPVVLPEEAGGLALGMDRPADPLVGTNVFVLFDTSNYMYRGFVYASDAIADFIRGLDRTDSVAVYTFSRNLSRTASLTQDRNSSHPGIAQGGRGRRLRSLQCDAAGASRCGEGTRPESGDRLLERPRQRQHGRARRRRAVAEDEGIPIYVISTNDANKDSISAAVFRRISTQTGGKAYFARTWQKQVEAFESIREDLGNSYTVTYYPAPNPNEGFRRIAVQIPTDAAKKYRIRARPGYRPRSAF